MADHFSKWKTKKARNYYQTNRQNLQERLRDYYENLPEDEKITKRIKIKICQMKIEKEKKYMRNY